MQLGELQMWATAIAIFGGSNWLFGGISWSGHSLRLRTTPVWIAIRWLGVGIFVASLYIGVTEEIRARVAGVTGAVLILLVSARRIERIKPSN